ncbi:hypothetical protein KC717_02060 [Candidatus Dojkabacteria bacterium]|uniref:Uncharacterized protein n=1 Tax=Candidatus Dojkabacteria bacterium TaxID=2099670 RepID=A0A955L877_9BACT|nr:hypothetical protein [Candidatus Dojkabacteria bacterium]
MKGSITLTTTVLASAILLAAGITLVLTGIDLGHTSETFQSNSLAQLRSRTCLEEGLYRVRQDTSFTGEVSHIYNDGSCTVDIQDHLSVVNVKVLDLTSIVDEFTFIDTKYVDISVEPYDISSNDPQQ